MSAVEEVKEGRPRRKRGHSRKAEEHVKQPRKPRDSWRWHNAVATRAAGTMGMHAVVVEGGWVCSGGVLWTVEVVNARARHHGGFAPGGR